MDVEFREPPPAKGGRKAHSKFTPVAEQLRANPGEWALIVPDSHHNMAGRINKGILPAFRPAGAFEATARSHGDRFDVYARYVGGDE